MKKLAIKNPSEIYNPTPAREIRDEALALANYAEGLSDALDTFANFDADFQELQFKAGALALEKAKASSPEKFAEVIAQAVFTATVNELDGAEVLLSFTEELMKVEDVTPKKSFVFASFA